MHIDTLLRRANVRGIELRGGIESFAHQLCKALRLRAVNVQWEGGITTAAINDDGDMLLADVRDDAVIGRAMIGKYAGFVLHELLHRKYTRFDVRANGQYRRAMHNAVEDAWIETRCIREGLVGNAGGLLSGLIDGMVAEALHEVSDWGDPRQYPFAAAIYLRDHATVKTPVADGLLPIFDEARARLNQCKSSADTLAISEWICDQLESLDDAQPEPQPGDGEPQPGDGDQDGQDGEQSGGEGQTDGEGDADGGEGGDQDGPSDASDGPESGDQGEGEGEGAGEETNAPKARPVRDRNAPAREVEPRIKGEPGAQGCFNREVEVGPVGHHASGRVMPIAPFNAPARLRAEVRRMFENTDRSGYEFNRRTGSVNASALPRVATGSDRVFKRHDEPEGIDSAVTILLDCSGSMWYGQVPNPDGSIGKYIANVEGRNETNIEAAVQACDALVDSLAAAGIAVEVVTFGEKVSVLCPAGTPAARIKAAVRTVKHEGATNDATGLRVAMERLYARPEQRKVVFVLTDGDGNGFGVKRQCKAGEALGITTVALGIGHDNTADEWYTNAIRVAKLSDLATAALSQIKVAA